MNRKKLIAFLKKQWILLWMVSAIASLTIVVSLAEYTNEDNIMKRVLAPSAHQDELFTSNYLTSAGNSKVIYFPKTDQPPYQDEVYVRNYHPSDPGTVYDGTITYQMQLTLCHANGEPYADGDNMTAWNNVSNDMSITLSYGNTTLTLSGSTRTQTSGNMTLTKTVTNENPNGIATHDWVISFNNIPLDSDYCAKVEAISATSGVASLSSVLRVAPNPEQRTEAWSGAFTDAQKDGAGTAIPIGTYDAFNYMIAGTGEKWLYFSYDPNVFTVNEAFAELNAEVTAYNTYKGTAATGHTGWKSIEIHADPETTKINRYDFQLYKASGFNVTSYAGLEAYVQFEALDAQQQ